MQEWIIAMLVISVLLILRDMAKTILTGRMSKKEEIFPIGEDHPQKEKVERYAAAFQKLADTFYGMPYKKEYLSSCLLYTSHTNMKLTIPSNAEKILHILEENGYEAYVVGGCVRDSILGRNPNDWDITTSASPQQVKELFHRTVDTGLQHGTVTVLMDKEGYEVTTYRVDGDYEDGRCV